MLASVAQKISNTSMRLVRGVVDHDCLSLVESFTKNGGVPPFGHSTQLRVFVDPDLLQYDEVWAAAGTWNDNFGANPNDIVRVAGGVVTDLKR